MSSSSLQIREKKEQRAVRSLEYLERPLDTPPQKKVRDTTEAPPAQKGYCRAKRFLLGHAASARDRLPRATAADSCTPRFLGSSVAPIGKLNLISLATFDPFALVRLGLFGSGLLRDAVSPHERRKKGVNKHESFVPASHEYSSFLEEVKKL